MPSFHPLAACLVVSLSAALWAPAARAAEPAEMPAPKMAPRLVAASKTVFNRVELVVNKSKVVKIGQPLGDVLIGNAEIGDVLPVSDQSLYVLGKKVGTTNVTLFDAEKRLIGVVDVVVKPDVAMVQEQVYESTGDTRIRVRAAGDRTVLTGTAYDAVAVDRAMQAAPPGTVNLTRVASPQQVLLKVRFVEINRTAARELGVRWDRFAANQIGGRAPTSIGRGSSTIKVDPQTGGIDRTATSAVDNPNPFVTILSTFGGFGRGLDVQLNALEEKGLVRRLAEPNLVALSGDTGEFLAGGRIPIPTAQTGTNGAPIITTTFEEFGVKLRYTPTVLNNGLIHLQMTPEVSDVDYTIGTSTGGIVIPGLTVRRAKTSIQLKDGQTFAIAGLLQNIQDRNIEQLPWLANIPVLGALFRSAAYRNRETELVMLVTPHLAKPGKPGDMIGDPTDATAPANDADLFLAGKTEVKRENVLKAARAKGISGPYGHIIPKPRVEKGEVIQ